MKLLLLLGYLLMVAAQLLLDWLNVRHRRLAAGQLPPLFAQRIDEERLRRSEEYALAKERIGLIETLLGVILTLVFIFGGLLPWYDRLIAGVSDHFILHGLLFFGVLALVQSLVGIPFSLYRNFVLEARFGFNRMGIGLWLTDLVKSLLIGTLLFVLLAGGALWLVQAAPHSWWLWVWGFWAGLSVFLLLLSPYLIEPLFFTFKPLDKPELEERVRSLLERAGVKAGKILQVDASKRSGHSNAYFTGIGKVKRVVLFDTLLEQLNDEELLAVLAHELGHWRCGHLRQRLIKGQIVALASCFVAFYLLNTHMLPGWFGMDELSFVGQVLLLGWLAGLLGFFWTPVSSWWSRRHERQADQFAIDLVGSGMPLATGLVTLARENLSSLFPHPLYAAFHYSHPPMIERVEWLQQRTPTNAGLSVGDGPAEG
ncbi:M48 family metallopeptidase [Pelobacter sp. M08fum]|uniref:M48 family metallopeptidase n=1 Tax=Pelovirga terrestris TaxID=2771352 RepID=A0A8J6R078_9BACT|nr:M48 family metallopeptidase [Pelovirga terrestris]